MTDVRALLTAPSALAVLPPEPLPPGEGWRSWSCGGLPEVGVIETWDQAMGPDTGFARVVRAGALLRIDGGIRRWWRQA